MAEGQNSSAPPVAGGQMMLMLLMLLMMTMLIMNPGIRNGLKDYADPVLNPIVPENSFILTVFIFGTISMAINTILRSFFMDPIAQAHLAHRQREINKMMQDARIDRDQVAMDTAMKLRERMLPEQMQLQMGVFKPMMFTMIFIIALFAWLASFAESFRVEYVSLPWTQNWNLTQDKFLFFPAWICAYITMSAPLGRVIDRHIKLVKYKTHPVVLAGDLIPEPYAEEMKIEQKNNTKKNFKSHNRKRVKNNSKTTSDYPKKENIRFEGINCPSCMSTDIERASKGMLRCVMCREMWRK